MIESAYIFAPQVPHRDTLADPRMLIRDATGTLLACYCPRHEVGGVYDLEARAWSL